ncbi:MAG: FAD-dependent oxidoreductase [Pseudomonadota bacterium]
MRSVLLIALVALIGAFFFFDLGSYLDLEYLKAQQAALSDYVAANPFKAAAAYFIAYVAIAGLSLPGATIITLLGGALFGIGWGTLLVSFGSTVGASCAFLFARYFFRDTVDRRFGEKIATINKGIETEGAFYLFSIRLIPIIPYFLVNLLMGLTTVKLWIFFVVSQLGMLPATIVYVNAGTQLAKIESLSDIVSAPLILSFVALGLLPLFAKKFIDWKRYHAALDGYEKPKQFDRNLVVIGAGSGGLVSAYIAAAVKADVSLVEKHLMGGDCLNTGCVPSKALIRCAKAAAQGQGAARFGVINHGQEVDFAKVMHHVRDAIQQIEPHDSVERYRDLGVECLSGEAEIVDPYHVKVNGNTLSTRAIILATGGEPLVPPIDGLDSISYLTSDSVWSLTTLPQKLLVVGAGPIGCELSQAFARLGSKVTIVQRGDRIMPREDPDVSTLMLEKLESEGITVVCGASAKSVSEEHGVKRLVCSSDSDASTREFEFNEILFAVGRKARINTLGIKELGIELRDNGTIATDQYLRTNIPTIYACGDATGPYQFTHVAAHQAWYASINALFGTFKKFAVDYRVIPWTTFTDPEVARVGLNEQEAAAQNIAVEITKYGIDDLDRAITDGTAYGFVKVLTPPGKDKILGVTIVGEHAGDLLAEFVLAMRHGLGLNKILGTIHTYPTLSEANKYAAGQWRRANQPAGLLKWVQRFHRWRRS